MKKFSDVITYVRNGEALNALVVQSTQTNLEDKSQPNGIRTEEHLTLIYLDPAMESGLMSGSAVDRSVSKAFGAAPLVEGGKNGWIAIAEDPRIAEWYQLIVNKNGEIHDLQTKLASVTSGVPIKEEPVQEDAPPVTDSSEPGAQPQVEEREPE